MGVILLSHGDQLLVVRLTVTREDGLEAGGIAHVVELVVKASLLCGIVDRIGCLFDPLSHDVVVCRSNPFDDLGVAEVDLGGVQSQGVTTSSLGGLHPVGTDGLPVQLDGGDVGGGDLLVQLGKLAEEGGVDDADTLVEFLVGGSLDSSSDEDITAVR